MIDLNTRMNILEASVSRVFPAADMTEVYDAPEGRRLGVLQGGRAGTLALEGLLTDPSDHDFEGRLYLALVELREHMLVTANTYLET